jgi:hypothetical protein
MIQWNKIPSKSLFIATNGDLNHFKIYISRYDRTFADVSHCYSLPFIRVNDEQELVVPMAQEIMHHYCMIRNYDQINFEILSSNMSRLTGFYFEDTVVNIPNYYWSFLAERQIFSQQNHSGVFLFLLENLERHFHYQVRVETKCDYFVPFAYYNTTHEERFIENAAKFSIKLGSRGKGMNLRIFADPQCEVSIYLSLSWAEVFSNLFRYNLAPLMSTCFAICFLTIASQAREKISLYQSFLNNFVFRMGLFVVLLQLRTYIAGIEKWAMGYDDLMWNTLNPDNLYHFHYIYIILVTLSSFFLVHAIVGIISIVEPIRLANFTSLIPLCWLATFSSLLIHTGIWLIILFFALFFLQAKTRSDRWRLSSLKMITMFVTGLMIPAIIIWIKDLMVVNGNLFRVGGFDNKFTILSFIWFVGCHYEFRYATDWLFYELSGLFVYLFCTIGIYRIHNIFPFLFLQIVVERMDLLKRL